MNQKLRSFLCALPALAGFADAGTAAGDCNGAVGNLVNHGSIGGIVATAPAVPGSLTLRRGLIEVLYAASPLDSDADADVNGLPDVWEDEHFPSQNVVDPEADPDDGTANRMEYLAGTDPRDRTSVPLPTGSLSGSVYALPIPLVAGRSYKLWATRDPASWHPRQTLTGDSKVQNLRFDESNFTSGPLHMSGQSARCFIHVEVSLS